MKIKIIIFILTIIIIGSGFSEEIKFKIVEKKGVVDIKYRDGKWEKPYINDIIPSGTEIFTGFHSQLSIEVGNGSYITINQLTNVKIEKIIITKEGVVTGLYLSRGYLVIFSKMMGKYKNKILVSLNQGNVEFNDSGGEVYLRQDKGAIIKSFSNNVKIGSRFKNIYFINKGEVCGILPSGQLIESDYYLRRKINVKPNNINESQEIIAYYDLLFQPYTSDIGTNDYYNVFRP